jgi:uncharacterized protein YcnI
MKLSAVVIVATGALVAAGSAFGHAKMSPPVALAKAGQLFSLAVPTEKEDSATTKVVLTVPAGFSIDAFIPTPGWKRDVQSTGSGEDAVIQKVTWSGGSAPSGEDAFFQFMGRTADAKTYAFSVQQTYADGSVVDWSGAESSDSPAPTIEAKSSFGGGGSSTLAIVALVLGALGLIVGGIALVAGGGKRQLA